MSQSVSSFFVIFANQIFPAKNCPSPPGIPPILASAIPSLKGTLTQHNLMKLLAFRLCAPELPSCTLPNCQLCAHRMPHCDDSNMGADRWQSGSVIWQSGSVQQPGNGQYVTSWHFVTSLGVTCHSVTFTIYDLHHLNRIYCYHLLKVKCLFGSDHFGL